MTGSASLFTMLVAALQHASDYNKADAARPVAVLWTDAARQWEALLPRLRAELPILTLGEYDPAARTGPAIWLRCMVARALPEADWPDGAVPILYLPGISRQELRAVDECPYHLQPLAELQYRGVLWTHKNGRDWTIAGFLQGCDDLQIEVSGDAATKAALQNSLSRVANEPLAALRAEAPITAAKLNALLNPEPVRNLLLWMDEPAAQKARLTDAEWTAFRATCRAEYGFDPDTDGELTAAGLLGRRDGVWQNAWNRVAESPNRYSHLPELLRRARPAAADALFHDPSSWPQDNETAEAALREALNSLKGQLATDARKQVRDLERAHGERRGWIWAELGRAPLAQVLTTLVTLADATESPCGGLTPEEVSRSYMGGAWRADDAVLDALAMRGSVEDLRAVKIAVEAIYRPWLQETAEAFQQAVSGYALPRAVTHPSSPSPGVCWLFADGLRYDVGQRVADALEQAGLDVTRRWQWAASPGVTATAKPAVTPVAGSLGPGPGFQCVAKRDGSKVTVQTLRRELANLGYAILTKDDTGSPAGAAWTECGALDSTGHSLGWKLALRVEGEVHEIAGRVSGLLAAGWSEVRIVTDHGWLLLPTGLPKTDLPEHLTDERKGRCARLKPSAYTPLQTVPWHWDEDVRIAVPPGIGCFVSGQEYEHGGLSPQECITPVLVVHSAAPSVPLATLASVRWKGLRCRIEVAGGSPGMVVDVRTKPADSAASVVASPKTLDAGGQASLVVPDDTHAGEAAVVVLLGPEGVVLAQQHTTVGEDR